MAQSGQTTQWSNSPSPKDRGYPRTYVNINAQFYLFISLSHPCGLKSKFNLQIETPGLARDFERNSGNLCTYNVRGQASSVTYWKRKVRIKIESHKMEISQLLLEKTSTCFEDIMATTRTGSRLLHCFCALSSIQRTTGCHTQQHQYTLLVQALRDRFVWGTVLLFSFKLW